MAQSKLLYSDVAESEAQEVPTSPTRKHGLKGNEMMVQDPTDATRSLGIRLRARAAPMSAQTVMALLTRSLFRVFREFGTRPHQIQSSFRLEVACIEPLYTAEIAITATNASSSPMLQMTADRLATVLDLLGFDFSLYDNVTAYDETDFDVVLDAWEQAEVTIASGFMANIAPREVR